MLIKENEKLKTEKANNRKNMMYGGAGATGNATGTGSGLPP